ncbi:phage baseplate assembly protein V [Parerythrobacter jejuensis]|uniref:Type IV secretion protein Rhs n=1 Tax=Parerythrobacter jejuensis TaxID=795812 RepID=A0A845AZV3_9SPHN|nr:phage baseplate assembly protein V [Parerythrobacter jejuensis]MXP31266.1 type IV secretion protein Rhs [Parerythrobacter jejuensis]MXP34026.1 type IV secretion protein Rhs [Parerythrobacter jejuensis]
MTTLGNPARTTGFAPVATPANWMALPHSAFVINVTDPANRGRVQVQLSAIDPQGEALVWARVATGFAGPDYGLFALPAIGEEVLVVFIDGDPASPVVVGAMWKGDDAPPEDTPSDDVNVWSLNGRNGSRIAIDESSQGSEVVSLETPDTMKITLTHNESIKLEMGQESITISNSGIDINSTGSVTVNASSLTMKASSTLVQCGSTTFTGDITCSKITTASVVSSSYTPGAGNVW